MVVGLADSGAKNAMKNTLCNVSTALYITCHYNQDKPEWMGGGVRQEEMAERLKHKMSPPCSY
jgi:hypothetical protein